MPNPPLSQVFSFLPIIIPPAGLSELNLCEYAILNLPICHSLFFKASVKFCVLIKKSWALKNEDTGNSRFFCPDVKSSLKIPQVFLEICQRHPVLRKKHGSYQCPFSAHSKIMKTAVESKISQLI